MKHKRVLLFLLVTLLAASLACSLGGGGDDPPLVDEAAEEAEAAPTKAVAEEPAAVEEESAAEFAPAESESEAEEVEESAEVKESNEYDTIFPLPEDIQNFMGQGDETPINFQTSLSLEDVIDFYRDAFDAENLTERAINTAITDTTFSMVFDGHVNGKALVIQGVDLGNGTTNVNLRFEDI